MSLSAAFQKEFRRLSLAYKANPMPIFFNPINSRISVILSEKKIEREMSNLLGIT